jgi:hypothetical protein
VSGCPASAVTDHSRCQWRRHCGSLWHGARRCRRRRRPADALPHCQSHAVPVPHWQLPLPLALALALSLLLAVTEDWLPLRLPLAFALPLAVTEDATQARRILRLSKSLRCQWVAISRCCTTSPWLRPGGNKLSKPLRPSATGSTRKAPGATLTTLLWVIFDEIIFQPRGTARMCSRRARAAAQLVHTSDKARGLPPAPTGDAAPG